MATLREIDTRLVLNVVLAKIPNAWRQVEFFDESNRHPNGLCWLVASTAFTSAFARSQAMFDLTT
jgi:hypothetical protein